ncbi:MAG: hypothetical protein HRT47_00230 [Candidatus Caenarcaniphilales bacterium]|nr:hypothetical protein [Candidatus Caenarcaniphilales bacterium]
MGISNNFNFDENFALRNNNLNRNNPIDHLRDQGDLVGINERISDLAGSITEIRPDAPLTNSSDIQITDEDLILEMEADFVNSFASGDMDDFDPRAIMAAAEFIKIQFNDEDSRQELFEDNLARMGLAGLDEDVLGEISSQAIEIVDAFELDGEDSSEKMRADMVDILLLDSDFDSEENRSVSNFDTDALNTVFNLDDIEQDQEIVQLYTISAYATSFWQTSDTLTVEEMIHDFSGQESLHSANKGHRGRGLYLW